MPASCLVRGSINIDEFFSVPHIVRPGETLSSTSYHHRAGGKGANQAFAAARASEVGSVVLDASIGKDGEWIKECLVEAGVDVGRVRTVEKRTGRAIIQSAKDGENSIVLHSGANFTSVDAFIPPSTTHLLLQNEIPLPSTTAYFQLAKSSSRSIITLLNPSPMPSKEEIQAFPWELVDWLLLNEGEAKDIVQALDSSSQPSENTYLHLDTPQQARDALDVISRLKQHPKLAKINCVCTLGALGVLVLQSTDNDPIISYYPSAPLWNPLRDTTGAGDCFAGYFVAGLMRRRGGGGGKEEMDVIIRECLTACAICVEVEGAMESIPLRSHVLARRAPVALG